MLPPRLNIAQAQGYQVDPPSGKQGPGKVVQRKFQDHDQKTSTFTASCVHFQADDGPSDCERHIMHHPEAAYGRRLLVVGADRNRPHGHIGVGTGSLSCIGPQPLAIVQIAIVPPVSWFWFTSLFFEHHTSSHVRSGVEGFRTK